MYDPIVIYTNEDLRMLDAEDLFAMFREAKNAESMVHGIKLIKKVQRDVSNMCVLLNGFDAVHNEEQNVR